MTEIHAERITRSIREICEDFERAAIAADWQAARKSWSQLLFRADTAIRESRGTRIEADALAAELLTYRPTRSARPAAPILAAHVYVFTANAPWVCAAIERRQTVRIDTLTGGYLQDHYAPDRRTVCGKKTSYPVTERFTSGGWPRLCELCPDCTRKLVEAGLIAPCDAPGQRH